ncbi:two pore channel protein 1-like isoform X2 [Palaemon carinicauda]|uniref:two pore channel protein 1-like isoform X2 n=1 Tax=Palaemon carinicauda TaxID=392227 RepID=UPI0035B66226
MTFDSVLACFSSATYIHPHLPRVSSLQNSAVVIAHHFLESFLLSREKPDDRTKTCRSSNKAAVSNQNKETKNTKHSDVPNEYSSTGAESSTSSYRQLQDPVSGTPVSTVDTSWEMNYHESAIYLEEGQNNDKFNSHPRDRAALPAYLLTHNHWFYSLDLAAALLLMSLAVIEKPAVFKNVPVGVHASIELFGLFLLGISIVMQYRWLGLRTFIKHKRSMVKTVSWTVMFLEAIVVIVRNETHFRVTRSLRPIFLVDSRYMGGVRRFLRQILQSVPPILEVLGILLFILIIFTTLGFYVFSPNKEDPYFSTFLQGFVSLYVLLTTANFPDVMMPAYAKSRWSAAFFIAFLAINLYFLMNLMLAIVFVVFSDIEKDKFRKLLLHKRRACQHSFRLLVTRSQPEHIPFRHFIGLVKYFKPNLSRRDAYLTFKALNKSETGLISLSEFYNIYDVCEYKWKPYQPPDPWFVDLPTPFRCCCFLIRRFVTWSWFHISVYFIIIVNGITLLVTTIMISASGEPISYNVDVTWAQVAFVVLYVIEANLKMIGLGLAEYFGCGWNVYDFIVTLLAIAGIIAEEFSSSFFYVVILRPLRLLRLFRIRRRYRDVFQTLVILLPRVMSAIVVIIITYYFFAIIGMELFSQFPMKNCCVNTTVEQFYKDDNTTIYINYYFLNNFDNLFVAGVTLFELTVVNNWFIIMEGYASVTGTDWSRMYFMLFYLVMMVVMSVVVAFILEAFTFRMEYNQTVKQDQDKEENTINISVYLNRDELRSIYRSATDTRTLQQYATVLENEGMVQYIGTRKRTRDVLQRRMYQEEIIKWLELDDQESQANPSEIVPELHSSHESPPIHISAFGTSESVPQQTPPSHFGSLNVNGSLNSSQEET